MENLKKNPLSLHLNVDDFAPASNDEKESLVIMRDSVSFWKDGLRRLRKNKIAMVSLLVIILIASSPMCCPWSGPTATTSRSNTARTWPPSSTARRSWSASPPARASSPTSWAPTATAVTSPSV